MCRRHQKRPSAVKKGCEGCHERLVSAADIKKGRRSSKKAKKAKKAAGYISRLFFLTRNADAGNTDDFFLRMQGTWLRQVPRILEKKSSGSLHRYIAIPVSFLSAHSRVSD